MCRNYEKLIVTIAIVALFMAVTCPTSAREVQLAGIRLGDHFINLLQVYGPPDCLVSGSGDMLGALAGGAGAGGEMGMPGMEGEMGPGGMPPGEEDMPMEAGAPPGDEMAMPPEGAGEFEPGPEGEAMGPGAGAGAAPSGAFSSQRFPTWALPAWIDASGSQIQWMYRRDGVDIGFLLDGNGFVRAISLAARKCDFARTALWRPHRYVKLGDSYKRVLYRYGFPSEQLSFTYTGQGGISAFGGAVSASFTPAHTSYTRDLLVRYEENNNISFTLHDMVVSGIYIWE